MKKIIVLISFLMTICLLFVACGSSNANSQTTQRTNFPKQTTAKATTSNQESTEKETTSCSHKWKSATCARAKTCAICGKTVGGKSSNHAWQPATCEAPKTCKTCKKAEGEALGHNWSEATCGSTKTCSVCKKTENTTGEHNWIDATCEAPKTCSICKITEGVKLEHDWQNATCEAPKTCSVCKATEGVKLEHNWQNATCEAPKTCSICKKTEGTIGEHNWQDATNSTPKTCLTCGETDGEPLLSRRERAFSALALYILSKGTAKTDSESQRYYSYAINNQGSNSTTMSINWSYYPADETIYINCLSTGSSITYEFMFEIPKETPWTSLFMAELKYASYDIIGYGLYSPSQITYNTSSLAFVNDSNWTSIEKELITEMAPLNATILKTALVATDALIISVNSTLNTDYSIKDFNFSNFIY